MADAKPNSFSRKNRFQIGLTVFLTLIAVVGVVAMINYLAFRYFYRSQWSSRSQVVLSDQTKGLLRSLTNTVNVHVFFDSDHELYSHVDALLKEYSRQSRFINLRTVDNVLNPAASREVISRFDLKDRNVVVFESVGGVRKIGDKELAETTIEPTENPREYRRRLASFSGERLFSSAILAVLETQPMKVYFLQGHGEHSPTDESYTGYKQFAQIVRDQNAEVHPLRLSETNAIPADCKLLVIAGANQALPPEELESIKQYLEQGGRAFILFNSQRLNTISGLEKVLARWRVSVGMNVIVSESRNLVLEAQPDYRHPVSSPLIGYTVLLTQPRSVNPIREGKADADAPKASTLLETEMKSRWMDQINAEGKVEPAETDPVGPATVATAVERGSITGVSTDKIATRIIVAGDSFFLDNGVIGQAANADFARLSLGWLMDRSVLLGGIGPRPLTEYRINLTKDQFRKVRLSLLAGMPGSVLLVGLIVWLLRRN